jgi:hypothetical protein
MQLSPRRVEMIVDLDIALAWIAISAASAKGLTVFARAAVTSETEEESTPTSFDGGRAYSTRHPIGAQPRQLHSHT